MEHKLLFRLQHIPTISHQSQTAMISLSRARAAWEREVKSGWRNAMEKSSSSCMRTNTTTFPLRVFLPMENKSYSLRFPIRRFHSRWGSCGPWIQTARMHINSPTQMRVTVTRRIGHQTENESSLSCERIRKMKRQIKRVLL